MRIIHVSTADTWRGGEQQIVYLFDELSDQIDQWVFCATDSRIELNCKLYGRNHVAFPKKSSLSLKFSRRLAEVVKEKSADLIHVHDSHAHTFAVIASRLFGMAQPIILHRRVHYPVSKNWFSHYKYNYPQIKRIICVSSEVKRILDNSLTDQSRSMIIHDGVDFEKFLNPDYGYLRKILSLVSDNVLVGNVAAITQQKDYFTFVDAAEIVSSQSDNVHFVVIGDGDQREEIETIVSGKNLRSRFTFLGFREDVPKLLPGLDILLFSSEKEGLGTTIIDALLAEVAIVTTNAGGITGIVRSRKEALITEVKDPQAMASAVMELIENSDLRTTLVNAGKERAKQFDKHDMALATLEVYNEVLNS